MRESSFGWREVSRFLSFLSEDFGGGWKKKGTSLTDERRNLLSRIRRRRR